MNRQRQIKQTMQKIRESNTMPNGFTLIEYVVVIVLVGIVSGIVTKIMLDPFKAANRAMQQSELLTDATSILKEMRQDLTAAVPNTVRVRESGNVTALELFPSVHVGRYYNFTEDDEPPGLELRAVDDYFRIAHGLTSQPNNLVNVYLIINNLGIIAQWQTPYDLSPNTGAPEHVAKALPLTALSNEAGHDDLIYTNLGNFNFQDVELDDSDRARLHLSYISHGPITYLCNNATNTMFRYEDYPIEMTQPIAFTGDGNLINDKIDYCEFHYEETRSLLMVKLLMKQGETEVLFYDWISVNDRL